MRETCFIGKTNMHNKILDIFNNLLKDKNIKFGYYDSTYSLIMYYKEVRICAYQLDIEDLDDFYGNYNYVYSRFEETISSALEYERSTRLFLDVILNYYEKENIRVTNKMFYLKIGKCEELIFEIKEIKYNTKLFIEKAEIYLTYKYYVRNIIFGRNTFYKNLDFKNFGLSILIEIRLLLLYVEEELMAIINSIKKLI